MNSGVYAIDGKNGEIYIGSAVNIKVRWQRHVWSLKNNTHENIHLQRAWNKHGADYFTFRVLELVPATLLMHHEQLWINIVLTSLDRSDVYNILTTAGSMRGYKLPEEHKRKIAESLKGKKHSDTRRLNQSLAKKNKPQSLSTKLKISEARRKRAARRHALQGTQEARRGTIDSNPSPNTTLEKECLKRRLDK